MISEVLATGQIWMSHDSNFHKMSWELLMITINNIFNSMLASILSHSVRQFLR